MSERKNLTGKPPLTDAERARNRAWAIVQNKGRAWSRAMEFAERTVYGELPDDYEAGSQHWKDKQR